VHKDGRRQHYGVRGQSAKILIGADDRPSSERESAVDCDGGARGATVGRSRVDGPSADIEKICKQEPRPGTLAGLQARRFDVDPCIIAGARDKRRARAREREKEGERETQRERQRERCWQDARRVHFRRRSIWMECVYVRKDLQGMTRLSPFAPRYDDNNDKMPIVVTTTATSRPRLLSSSAAVQL